MLLLDVLQLALFLNQAKDCLVDSPFHIDFIIRIIYNTFVGVFFSVVSLPKLVHFTNRFHNVALITLYYTVSSPRLTLLVELPAYVNILTLYLCNHRWVNKTLTPQRQFVSLINQLHPLKVIINNPH